MDDGSNDGTSNQVEAWKNESKILISYYYQINQGRFAAYNNVIDFAKGELFIFVDSDDYLKNNGLKIIKDFWDSGCVAEEKCCGIMAYCENEGGDLIGSEFPEKIVDEKIYTLYDKYRMTGDKTIILKTTIAKNYKYTLYPNEKFTGDNIIFIDICKDEYKFSLLRETLQTKEYTENGLTKSLKSHHINSCNGMADHYKKLLEVEQYCKFSILKHAIGYLIFSKIAKRKNLIKDSPNKVAVIIAYPFSFIVKKLKY